MGDWIWLNTTDGNRIAQSLTSAGVLQERGQDVGAWHMAGGKLIVTYKDHPWVYTYDLPPQDGVLHGHNKRGDVLTLTRATAKDSSVAVSANTANPAPTASGRTSYFGTIQPVDSLPSPCLTPQPTASAATGNPTAK